MKHSQANAIPWTHCVGVGVDNTVNLGICNSIMTRVVVKNPSIYFMGCSCHIVHNTALKASEGFLKVNKFFGCDTRMLVSEYMQTTRFDVEEMMVDTYFYFDKSTKRKNNLAEYSSFCDIEYRQVLKHVSTRWLSLEKTIDRTLQQLSALKSYFLSQGILYLL